MSLFVVLPHLCDVHALAVLHGPLARHRDSFLVASVVLCVVVFIYSKMLGSKIHSPELESELEDEFLRPSAGLNGLAFWDRECIWAFYCWYTIWGFCCCCKTCSWGICYGICWMPCWACMTPTCPWSICCICLPPVYWVYCICWFIAG